MLFIFIFILWTLIFLTLFCNNNGQILTDYVKKERQLYHLVRRKMENTEPKYRKSEEKRLANRAMREIMANYDQKVGRKKAKKMRKYNQKISAQFDEFKFLEETKMYKICNEEPLKMSEYVISKLPTFGIYHIGVFVCGIEIHYHGSEQGIRYWKPMENITKSGGTHRGFKTLYLDDGRAIYTNKNFAEITFTVDILHKYFNIYNFNVLTKNCIHFARALVRQIGDIGPYAKIKWPRAAVPPPKRWYRYPYPKRWPRPKVPPPKAWRPKLGE